MKELLRKYIEKNLETEKEKTVHPRVCCSIIEPEEISCSEEYKEKAYQKSKKKSAVSPIREYIEGTKDFNIFHTVLFRMIEERNLNDSDVYNKVHIDRRLFSKIRSDKNYHPSKETVILLGLSLELNEKEIVELLNSAAYSLPKNNYYDLIIRFCFENKIYRIADVNELLEEYKCRLFNY